VLREPKIFEKEILHIGRRGAQERALGKVNLQ